jgi:hypothetical protein
VFILEEDIRRLELLIKEIGEIADRNKWPALFLCSGDRYYHLAQGDTLTLVGMAADAFSQSLFHLQKWDWAKDTDTAS